MTPTPWGPTTHEWLLPIGGPPCAAKAVTTDDYERARLCVNACHGIADSTLLSLRPGDIQALLRKKVKTSQPALFDKGEEAMSEHKWSVEHWCFAWGQTYGAAYPFDGGKDGKVIKDLLRMCGGWDVFREVVNRYMADADEFVLKQRHSLGLLRSQVHRWLVAEAKVQPQQRDPIQESMDRMKARYKGGE